MFDDIHLSSLEYWLGEIKNNSNGEKLTHWEIEVVVSPLEETLDFRLIKKIKPLLIVLTAEGKTHKYKSQVAEFALKLTKEWRQMQDKDPF